MNITNLNSNAAFQPNLMTQSLLILLLSIPGLTWLSTVGDITNYWRYDAPVGQVVYLFSKLVGLYAVVLFWLQLIYGILGFPLRKKLNIEWGNRFHRRMGGLTFLCVLIHAACFVGGASIRTNHFASQYLTPSLSDGYYRAIVTVGIIALYFTVLGLVFALLRKTLGPFWRIGHGVLMPAFLLGFIHSALIGSESRVAPMIWLYGVMLVVLLGAMSMRFATARVAK